MRMELNSSGVTLAESFQSVNRKSTNNRKLYIFAGIISVCTLGFIIATVYLAYKVSRTKEVLTNTNQQLTLAREEINEFNQREPICNTKECITSAATLLESMDLTADPCNDFHQFTCGGWLKKHGIPESYSRWSQFDVLRDQVQNELREILKEPNSALDSKPLNSSRNMYAACMDIDSIEKLGLEPITQLLKTHGYWPMTYSNWSSRKFDWRNSSIAIRLSSGDGFLFELYNSLDTNNTDVSVLYVDQAGLGLPYATLMNSTTNSTKTLMEAYAAYMTDTAKLIRNHIKGGTNDSTIENDVEQVIQFQIDLAKIQTPPEGRRNKTRMYNPMTISALQNLTNNLNTNNPLRGYVNWSLFINRIYSTVNIAVSPNDTIVIKEIEYLKKLLLLLDQTPHRVIANYLYWRLVMRIGGETSQEMGQLSFRFWKVFAGTSSSQPRWTGCVSRVTGYLGFALGADYINRTFDEKSKKDVVEMIQLLKSSFVSLVRESDWMDEVTKKKALEKADAMREFIAYPPWLRNHTKLNELYEGVETSNNTHFQNLVNVTQALIKINLKELRKPTDRTKWITFPSIVNAYYQFHYNSITFPAGVLQSPFFRKGHLAAMNYGGIGGVIGHEITHGFDDQGRQTDKDGKVQPWWTNNTLNKYLTKAQCFIEQYGNYTYPQFNGTEAHKINGVISQGENIADNVGIREAFRAYQNYVSLHGREARLPGLEQYTPEQIFFISFGNIWCAKSTTESLKQQILNGPHSPDRERVHGPLSNSEDFARLFKCPIGNMSRAKKCLLW